MEKETLQTVGKVPDLQDPHVATAYYLPIVCYLIIFLFGYKFYKVE